MKIEWKIIFVISAAMFIFTGYGWCESVVGTFNSPSGRFTVEFIEVSSSYVDEPTENCDEYSEVDYKIRVLDEKKLLIESVDYIDMATYPVAALFEKMIWSPKEDFVFMPAIQACIVPITQSRYVVNLNPSNKWHFSLIIFEDLSWADETTLYGGVSGENIPYTVYKFDGKRGEQKALFTIKGEKSWGAKVIAASKEGLAIDPQGNLIDKVRDRKEFSCQLYSFDGAKHTDITCPK